MNYHDDMYLSYYLFINNKKIFNLIRREKKNDHQIYSIDKTIKESKYIDGLFYLKNNLSRNSLNNKIYNILINLKF